MSTQQFTLETLKNRTLDGFLMFTNAIETGGEINGHNFITGSTRPGIDLALMNIGFQFIPEGGSPSSGMYSMHRHNREKLRYHPIREKASRAFQAAIDHGLKTRIDFFCHQNSDAAYDVVRELLDLGYTVMTFDPKNRIVEFPAWHLIEPSEGALPVIREIR